MTIIEICLKLTLYISRHHLITIVNVYIQRESRGTKIGTL